VSARHEFLVRVSHDYEYKVAAEDADEAEQIVQEGEAGDGECIGYSVNEVVSAGKADDIDAQDERTQCVCGHLMFNGHHTGLWSGDVGSRTKPHPRACNSLGCPCLEPVEKAVAVHA
jgi:hypothetical protein